MVNQDETIVNKIVGISENYFITFASFFVGSVIDVTRILIFRPLGLAKPMKPSWNLLFELGVCIGQNVLHKFKGNFYGLGLISSRIQNNFTYFQVSMACGFS